MEEVKRIKELVKQLNIYRDEYYNKSNSSIADKEYDVLIDELSRLEEETGVILSNSPTQTVGYEVKSKLEKHMHSHPMLSLDKTKSVSTLKEFASNQDSLLMHKLDGLTILLTYDNGELILAETRGNGEEGEVITHNAKVFQNIPLTIDFKGCLEIEGEAIITYHDFNRINSSLSVESKYKNPRNLVSGSVRQLDSKIAARRNIKFIAWKVPKGIDDNSFLGRLKFIEKLGFDIVPLWTYRNATYDEEHIGEMIEDLKGKARKFGVPIDGLVMAYNDIAYGESLGNTGHHPRHSIAFKFYDEEVETKLLDIEWSPSRTGLLNPVAIFDPVEIDGTTVSRASLHNLSIIEDLELGIGDTITVYKANQIIPQIKDNLTRSDKLFIPMLCPICGEPTHIQKDNDSKVLYCTNSNCKSKLVGKLVHFVSKNAINVDGMSEATIEKFVELGWLNNLEDIYNLKQYRDKMIALDGFGMKSVNKLLDAIEDSRQVRLENLLYSVGIPLIGRTASKDISKFCNGYLCEFIEFISNGFDFSSVVEGFGVTMNSSLYSWMKDNKDMFMTLSKEFVIDRDEVKENANNSLEGLTFVITGSVNHYKNRDVLKADIESRKGKVAGSVSSKTSYLINNDSVSLSSKNKKAKELGVKIITEDEFIKLIRI